MVAVGRARQRRGAGWLRLAAALTIYSPEMQARSSRSLKTKVPLQRHGTESEVSAAIVPC